MPLPVDVASCPIQFKHATGRRAVLVVPALPPPVVEPDADSAAEPALHFDGGQILIEGLHSSRREQRQPLGILSKTRVIRKVWIQPERDVIRRRPLLEATRAATTAILHNRQWR